MIFFNDFPKFKKNKNIRLIECGKINQLPKYYGDSTQQHLTIKTLADGSFVIAEPLLTSLKNIDNLKPASAKNKEDEEIMSFVQINEQEKKDLLTAWYINIGVRSNGIIIVKGNESLAIGTGEQDRVGALEQAIEKFNTKYEGEETIEGSVMSSDGFFPFPDSIEIAAKVGIKAIIAPAGSIRDYTVIEKANKLNVALFFSKERIFAHH